MKHINKTKEINSLYDLIKNTYQKKEQKLKIICDWDDTVQVFLPFVTWNLKGESTSFQDFYKTFWQKEFISYNQFIDKFNKREKERYEELKIEPNLYKISPFLSLAKELLVALQENLIEELIFLTACNRVNFPSGDSRKSEVFEELFSYFPNTRLEFLPHVGGTIAPKGQWVRKNHPNFDIFIDDVPEIISKTAEIFPDKIYVLPDYGYGDKLKEDNVYHLTVNLASKEELVEQQKERFIYKQEVVKK